MMQAVYQNLLVAKMDQARVNVSCNSSWANGCDWQQVVSLASYFQFFTRSLYAWQRV